LETPAKHQGNYEPHQQQEHRHGDRGDGDQDRPALGKPIVPLDQEKHQLNDEQDND
jgi:hypothetical protein